MKLIRLSVFSLFLCLFCVSCASLNLWQTRHMYNPIENMHITEPVRLKNSPFDSLIDETFSISKNPDRKKHYVRLLEIGNQALLARIHLIRQAQKTINIQAFIWTNDESGRFVAYELIKAAERGVKVKIINDQWRGKDTANFVAFFNNAHPNIEIKNYNPAANRIDPSQLTFLKEVLFKFKQVNQRMHNKIFVVDDRIGITGGRNYENDYYDRGTTRNFKDRDIIVIGPVVHDMTTSFMKYWAFKLSVDSNQLTDVKEKLKVRKFSRYETELKDYNIPLFEKLNTREADLKDLTKTFAENLFLVEDVKFVYDPPGKNNSLSLSGGSVTASELSELLSTADESIVAQTPYLVLDRKLEKRFKKLRKKNPDLDIRISTNSLASTDHVHAYAFAYKQKRVFVQKLKFRIFEFKPVPADVKTFMPRFDLEVVQEDEDAENLSSFSAVTDVFDEIKEMTNLINEKKHLCIHGKSFTFDTDISWVGSFNIDPRSAHLNTEVGLIIEDAPFTRHLRDVMLRDMAPQNSWTVGVFAENQIVAKTKNVITEALGYVPFVDIWPFHNTANYELKEGKEEVPFYHEDFFKNYKNVGAFPEVGLSLDEIQLRLLKTFGGFATPII